MELTSYSFLLFLAIVVIAYFCTPQRFRWVVLLAASYYFYASMKLEYAAFILLSTLVTYALALLIRKRPRGSGERRVLFWSGVTFHLVMLLVFKYFNFVSKSVASFFDVFSLHLSPWTIALLAPIGISFYTFQ